MQDFPGYSKNRHHDEIGFAAMSILVMACIVIYPLSVATGLAHKYWLKWKLRHDPLTIHKAGTIIRR